LTSKTGTRDNAALMAVQAFDYPRIVESRFPGLIEELHKIIQESENKHDGSDSSESFLWEHTMHATSIACKLAEAEGMDPLIPVVAALFHDAGKFADGHYHKDQTIEEEQSAEIAARLLRKHGMKPVEIRKVLAALKALYNEKAGKNAISSILHDADFLSKFGALGVAAFFTKSVLRRRTLRSTVLGYLSKELTYASCLPLNMRTAAGRKLATRKAADSLRFFRNLLSELRDARIADLKIRQIQVYSSEAKHRVFQLQLVVSPSCPKCGSVWDFGWTIEKSVKCRKLTVDWACECCGERLETSFCLPEIT
jgi:putative nucleotidyltransferase with HDIG domain